MQLATAIFGSRVAAEVTRLKFHLWLTRLRSAATDRLRLPTTALFVAGATLIALLSGAQLAHAQPDANRSESPQAAAEKEYEQARARYSKEPTNSEAAWQFGRACFDLADGAQTKKQRAQIAREGIAACEDLVKGHPDSAPGHYYLGMNLGELAETQTLGALKLVPRIQREFDAARSLDEHFDNAGPDRNLGLLYRDAPSFGSIGDRSLARQHLLRATELAPDFPENRLSWIESELKWGDKAGASRDLKALDQKLPSARQQLTGPQWTSSWADWEARLKELKRKLG